MLEKLLMSNLFLISIIFICMFIIAMIFIKIFNKFVDSISEKIKTDKQETRVVFFTIIVIVVALFTIFPSDSSKPYQNYEDFNQEKYSYEEEKVQIKYMVSSPGNIDVTYNNSDGDTTQKINAYSNSFKVEAYEGDFFYFSAQNQKDYGEVKIEMYVDGELYRTNSSYGEYCIATVSGTLNFE